MFIVHVLARMDGEFDFEYVDNQIQAYQFERLASGQDASHNNSRESESARQVKMATTIIVIMTSFI